MKLFLHILLSLFALAPEIALTQSIYPATSVPVTAFGAKCNGSFDDTAAFQAAHDSATYGLTIQIPPGVCQISANINISKPNIRWTGAGQASLVKAIGNAVTKVFNVTTGNPANQVVYPQFANFQIDGSAATTSGGVTGIYLLTVRDVHMDNLFFTGLHYNIWIDHQASENSSARIFLTNSYITGPPSGDNTARGLLVDMNAGTGLVLTNDFFWAFNVNNLNVGIEVRSGQDFDWNQVNVAGWGKAVVFDPPAGFFARQGQIQGLKADSSYSDGLTLDGSASSPTYPNGVTGFQFTDLWASSNGITASPWGVGVRHTDAQGITYHNPQIDSNGLQGFLAGAGATKGNSITGGQITGNSNSSSGTYSGVELQSGVNTFSITGVIIGPTQWYANSQKYGIVIDAGAQKYSIVGNNLWGGTTGGCQDNALDTNSVYAGNTNPGNCHP